MADSIRAVEPGKFFFCPSCQKMHLALGLGVLCPCGTYIPVQAQYCGR